MGQGGCGRDHDAEVAAFRSHKVGASWKRLSFLPTNQREPKVSKGRPESPLAASAEAESRRSSSVDAVSGATAGCSDETGRFC